jgi:hypothetical protein
LYNCSWRNPVEDKDNAMNKGNRESRRAGLLTFLAAVAVLATATACGGNASSSGAGSGGSTGYQQMLAYSQCMRTHGVPDFPDPNASGNIQVAPGSPDDPMNGPQEQVANNACRHLEPGGGSNSGISSQTVQQLLKMAQCLRAHGVPDFPDPVVHGNSVTLPTRMNFSSPQFQSAERACKSLIPAGMFPPAS